MTDLVRDGDGFLRVAHCTGCIISFAVTEKVLSGSGVTFACVSRIFLCFKETIAERELWNKLSKGTWSCSFGTPTAERYVWLSSFSGFRLPWLVLYSFSHHSWKVLILVLPCWANSLSQCSPEVWYCKVSLVNVEVGFDCWRSLIAPWSSLVALSWDNRDSCRLSKYVPKLTRSRTQLNLPIRKTHRHKNTT